MAAVTIEKVCEGGKLDIEKICQNADKRESVAAAVAGHEAVMEPKYDGWRTIWIVDAEGKARFFSRAGNELTGAMPAIEAEIGRVFPPGSIVDAEAVVFKMEHGRLVHKCNEVAKILGSGTAKAALRSGALSLVVFDLIAHGGVDARALPFGKRRAALEAIFDKAAFAPNIALTPQLEATEENYDVLLAEGYEGGMVKWLDAPYASGARGKGQWKLKAQHTVDVIVTGYKEGTKGGSFDGLVGAVHFGQYDENGNMIERGKCSGMDFDLRVEISNNRDKYLGTVFEMKHMGIQKPENGAQARFRHPNFQRFRADRAPESVVVHDG